MDLWLIIFYQLQIGDIIKIDISVSKQVGAVCTLIQHLLKIIFHACINPAIGFCLFHAPDGRVFTTGTQVPFRLSPPDRQDFGVGIKKQGFPRILIITGKVNAVDKTVRGASGQCQGGSMQVFQAGGIEFINGGSKKIPDLRIARLLYSQFFQRTAGRHISLGRLSCQVSELILCLLKGGAPGSRIPLCSDNQTHTET